MESRFELGLVKQGRSVLGFVLAIASVFALVAVVINHIPKSNWQTAAGLITLLGGGFIAYRLLKRWVKYEVVISVGRDDIVVQQAADRKEVTISFASLVSYRHESSNGVQQLHLKLTDGHKVKLSANDVFGKVGDFGGLVHAIEQATTNRRNETAVVIIREPGFFEKPISTVLLVVVTALFALSIGKIVRDDLPIQGNMVTGVGVYITYLGAWLAASKRRNQVRQ